MESLQAQQRAVIKAIGVKAVFLEGLTAKTEEEFRHLRDCVLSLQVSVSIATKRDNDRVEVKFEKDHVIFSAQSPFGISHAAIEQAGKTWPDTVVLRLHLQGLENFKVTNGKVTLEGSASLQDGKPLVRLWKDGKEDTPLDARSPYWIEIRIVGCDGKPAKEIPLNSGYFEMVLPKALFERNPKTIAVNWIDFYRN